MKETFYQKLAQLTTPSRNHYLLAISGGVDSMVLLHLMQQLNLNFSVAHCNYQLRKQAKQEESLIKAQCLKQNITYHITKFNTTHYATEKKLSIQMAARELRYQWFQKLCHEHKYTHIITAHHLNDNIETILLNLTKGTGIKGLIGIAEQKNNVIRPMLQFSKEQIYKYAKNNKIQFLEDSSNQKNEYQRNKIRNEIIPILKEINPNIEQTINKNIELYKFNYQLKQREISRARNRLIHCENKDTFIYLNQLLSYPNAKIIFHELLKTYNFKSSESLNCWLKLPTSQTGATFESSTHTLLLHRNKILIYSSDKFKRNNLISITKKDVENQESYTLNNKTIRFQLKKVPQTINTSKNTIQIDADKVEYPLIIRHWLAGDYFYPIGLGKKQKLKKYFTNNKFSIKEKQEVPLLFSNEKLIWVISHRLDERYKITPNTKQIIEISYR